ncbi:hypothetical protein [Duganella radicis]|uniref:hypothetical protein n=1 Tax=Duganella radicis TaxID=551988 RepID=UPI00353113DD
MVAGCPQHGERHALASLYCALVTDHCLNGLGSYGAILIEDSFTQSTCTPAFCSGYGRNRECRMTAAARCTALGC